LKRFLGIDLATEGKPSTLAVLCGEDPPLTLSGLSEFGSKTELLKLLEDFGARDLAVDVPLYLPKEPESLREEEKALRKLCIASYSPRAKSMLPLHMWARDLFEIDGEIEKEGFALGFGGKTRVFEIYPNATFTLLGRTVNPAPLAPKRTVSGVFQRLDILARFVRLPEDWSKLMTLRCKVDDALDAAAAALTHFFIETKRAQRLGRCLWVPSTSPQEGSSSP
jgi:predicted nuclease with RNAse H fold